MWQHLDGLARIGTRGPGESQLEHRPAPGTPSHRAPEAVPGGLSSASRRACKARERSVAPVVALAGYTNAGKSTLLNALTDAEVAVDDRLFETLDPTTRGFQHDGRRYLVTDTVGFIRRLPHQLVEGFAATLEETLLADLVLRVADAGTSGRAPRRDDRRGRLRPQAYRRRRASDRLRPQQDRPRRPAPAAALATASPAPCRSRPGWGGAAGAALGTPSASRTASAPCAPARPVRRGPRPQGAVRPGSSHRGDRVTVSSFRRGCPSASCRATRRT